MRIIGSLFALALLAACEATPQPAQFAAAASLSREHFAYTASVSDDALDLVAKITTANGFRARRGLFDNSWDDNFLRAFVDKRTGRTTYQVYQDLFYRGDHMRRYYAANYAGLGGPRSAEVVVIDRDAICTGRRYSGCAYFETLGFDVDEDVLRAIAERYWAGSKDAWNFKFRARSGEEFHTGMTPAEVAGLLQAVDDYRARRGLN